MIESWTPSTWRWTILCGATAIAAVIFIDSGLNGADEPADIAFGDRSVCKQAAMLEAREHDPVPLTATMSEAQADIVVQYCSPDRSEAPD